LGVENSRGLLYIMWVAPNQKMKKILRPHPRH